MQVLRKSLLILTLVLANHFGAKASIKCQLFTEKSHFLSELLRFSKLDFKKNPLTVGIEIEGVVPASMGTIGLSKVAKEVLEKEVGPVEFKMGVEIVGRRIVTPTYEFKYTKDGHEYLWKIIHDFTVFPSKGFVDAELVSPILRSQEDIALFYRVTEAFEKSGFQKEPSTSGIHIHIGFPEPQLNELALLARTFAAIEEEVVSAFSKSPHRRSKVGPTSKDLIAEIDRGLPNIKSLEEFMDHFFLLKNSRYVGLNLHSMRKFGTVELRIFNSTLNPKELDVMVDFASKLVIGLRTQNPKLMKLLRESDPSQLRLENIAEALGMKVARSEEILEKFKTDLEQRLDEMQSLPFYTKNVNMRMLRSQVNDIFHFTFSNIDHLPQNVQRLVKNLRRVVGITATISLLLLL